MAVELYANAGSFDSAQDDRARGAVGNVSDHSARAAGFVVGGFGPQAGHHVLQSAIAIGMAVLIGLAGTIDEQTFIGRAFLPAGQQAPGFAKRLELR